MFKKRLYYFQLSFLVNKEGEQKALVITAKKPMISALNVRNAAISLGLSGDKVPVNLICYGRMTEREWQGLE